MKPSRWLMIAAILPFFTAIASAQDASRKDALPPEKTQIIYDTLLPSGTAAEKTPKPKGESPPHASPSKTKRTAMTAERVLEILKGRDIALQGKPGEWEFSYQGRQIFLLLDSEHNRIRLLTPVARLDLLRQNSDFKEIELLQSLLGANYLTTGDVRFCLNNHVIWVAFLHPLDSLPRRDLLSALDQLIEVAQKTREGSN